MFLHISKLILEALFWIHSSAVNFFLLSKNLMLTFVKVILSSFPLSNFVKTIVVESFTFLCLESGLILLRSLTYWILIYCAHFLVQFELFFAIVITLPRIDIHVEDLVRLCLIIVFTLIFQLEPWMGFSIQIFECIWGIIKALVVSYAL